MRRWRFSSCIISLASAALTWTLLALNIPEAFAIEVRRGENVDVTGAFSESLFASGENVTSNLQSTDDVFLAGGRVTHSGRTTENLFIAGGHLNLSAAQAEFAALASGEIRISGGHYRDLMLASGNAIVENVSIEDDLVLAAGDVEIGHGTRIADSVTINGGRIVFDGESGGDATISGRDVTITGTFAKNLRVRARSVTLGPEAIIHGDFTHNADSIRISPTAMIQGRTLALPAAPSTSGLWPILAALLFFVGLLLAPAVTAMAFPKFVAMAGEDILRNFWNRLGMGLLAMIGVPIALVLLFASVIGVPLALVAIPFLIVAALMTWAISVHLIGRQLRTWYQIRSSASLDPESNVPRFGWTVLGALGFIMILAIPVLGFAFCTALLLAATGAVVAQMLGRFSRPPIPTRSDSSQRLATT